MQSRRKLLLGFGAATAVSLAGCAEDAQSEPPEEDNVDREIQAFHRSEDEVCAEQEESEINVARHPEFANQVSFEGTLLTPTPCYEAEIANETYDEETGVYTVTIAPKSAGDGCDDCIGEATYSGGLHFEDEIPLTVRIEHDSSEDDAAEELEI